MKSYTNTFQGWTTVVIEIEQNGPSLTEILDQINWATILHVGPNTIINKHDEDISYGHRIVFVTDRNESTIQAAIDDITELVW
jgi:hypothetical protein